MKVALIMYGHLRTYKKCYKNLKVNLLDVYNPDVFIHTWDETEARTISWHNRHTDIKQLSEADIKEISDMYKPSRMLIQKQEPVENDITTPNNAISSKGQEYMLYSLWAANEMKKSYEKDNGFKYDLVIKIRPDIMLLSPMKLAPIKMGSVTIAANRTVPRHSQNPQHYRACDIINICNSTDMDKICLVKNEFQEFFVDNVINKNFIHSGFVDFLLSKKLKLNFVDYVYNKDWTILREASK
jgi:hypothetical protein